MVAEIQSVKAVAGPESVVAALRQASASTGFDFDYLLSTAMRESSLQPQAKSKSSSATGLFQFIDQTWLGLVKRHGEKHGLGDFAKAIQNDASGRCTVGSAELKSEILALRNDPRVSALMAGEGAKETKEALECSLGRNVSCGELYAAHFLGQGGARKLLSLHSQNPAQRADLAFPEAAKANRAVFYHRDGSAKSIGDIYNWTVNKTTSQPGPQTGATPSVEAQAAPKAASLELTARNVSPRTAPRVSVAEASAAIPQVSLRGSVDFTPTYASPMPMTRTSLVLSPSVIEILAALNSPEFTRAEREI